ncbi:IclR family transcriptional regulator [Agilicoccus flavus]|uniref:IclR family transcriptional regulator n=1 Tax=Agilicoccus flavus TaxID=2775968 RepID=UPI001CF6A9A1|nr:IclR family transcriptional regulator [Agilicoccus flavus]
MDTSPAVAHALGILGALAAGAGPQSAAALGRAVGVPRSTTYRILTTMTDSGYVVHVPGAGYALGPAARELAWAYQRQAPLQRVAGPLLSELADRVGHNAHFSMLQGNDVLYVIEERVKGRPWLVTDVGVRLPAELTASGHAMLAHLSSAQISALYPAKNVLADRGTDGPTTVSQLRRRLAYVRAAGFATESQLVTAGLDSVAVAVVDRVGHPLAAVAVTYPTQTPQAEVAQILERVRRTVAAIGARLDRRPA